MRLAWGATPGQSTEFGQTWSFRGTKSRNKVSVGEPAEGSLERLCLFDSWGRGERRLWGRRCGALFWFFRGHVPAGEVPACAPVCLSTHTLWSLFCSFIFQPGSSRAQTQTKRVQDRVTQTYKYTNIQNFQQRISWFSHR